MTHSIVFGAVLSWVLLTLGRSWWWVVLLSALLSLSLEVVQWWLPQRYPATSDLLLNTAGGALGGMLFAFLLFAARASLRSEHPGTVGGGDPPS